MYGAYPNHSHQSVSALTQFPPGIFQDSGSQFTTFGTYQSVYSRVLRHLPVHTVLHQRGEITYNVLVSGFEYWSDPKNASDGYIIWQTGGQPTARMGAGALGPDLGVAGTQVGQRLISVEPMVRNLPF